MGIKQLYNGNLQILPKEYGDVSVICMKNANEKIVKNTRKCKLVAQHVIDWGVKQHSSITSNLFHNKIAV